MLLRFHENRSQGGQGRAILTTGIRMPKWSFRGVDPREPDDCSAMCLTLIVKKLLVFGACLLGWALTIPAFVLGQPAQTLLDDDAHQLLALGDTVSGQSLSQEENHFLHTGALRFDGQSAVAADQMTLLGLGQIVLAHPEMKGRYLPAMRRAASRLVDPRTLDYAVAEYGHHGVSHMGPGEGHAYLGYINLGIGMLRVIEPENEFADVHDEMTHALALRLFASPTGMIDTYPGEYWPPDVAAVAGSIGLHARATGQNRTGEIAAWAGRFADCAIHSSGFLVQRLEGASCTPADAPRGSGTAVAAYFLSFVEPNLSRRLYEALRSVGFRSTFGYGALREYAPGFSGLGDGNSGPVLFGVSVGATGFGLGAARAAGDNDAFVHMFRTTNLFGMLSSTKDGREAFLGGGRLGNSLLLAMLTARRPNNDR